MKSGWSARVNTLEMTENPNSYTHPKEKPYNVYSKKRILKEKIGVIDSILHNHATADGTIQLGYYCYVDKREDIIPAVQRMTAKIREGLDNINNALKAVNYYADSEPVINYKEKE